jgi:phosphoglycolate phosphatase
MGRIKLVIFDLDGTLVDSLTELAAATNHVRTFFGLPAFTESEVRGMLGNGGERLVKKALPNAGTEALKQAQTIYLDYSRTHLLQSTRIYPGVVDVLKALHQLGIGMAVLSNKHSKLSRELLRCLGIDSYISAILGPDTYTICKPSPEPVLKLLDEFAATADECVLVGDSINDIAAGKSAGVVTVGCLYGYCEASELTAADHLIASINELLELSLFA